MKNFTDLFIRRPVLALVVSLVIVIAGVQAISSLNVRQYPKSDIASVTVTTAYVGASAELVRARVEGEEESQTGDLSPPATVSSPETFRGWSGVQLSPLALPCPFHRGEPGV
jgi:multidrug efflux pump subunit AcrB